ncbi:hypothetical protein AeMF1_014746 [Aphanomyces euteiches]|nr:hypothetical protein AeMF1_014746 [Aphanomyces euteiches]KAH9191033.1 hypothetical protein AeNC1_006992 [Aphanomyces euteiches]
MEDDDIFGSNDGFSDDGGDFEQIDRVWTEKESNAMERRFRTVGYLDGLDVGKEETLQEGFNQGYALGASHGFQCGVLQGLLRAFAIQFPDQANDATLLLEKLRATESIAIQEDAIPSVTEADVQDVHNVIGSALPTIVSLTHLHDKSNHESG